MRYRSKPAYLKPPKDKCEVCGTSLLGLFRFRVYLYFPSHPRVPYKHYVVCAGCARKILNEERVNRVFKTRYRSMKVLRGIYHGWW